MNFSTGDSQPLPTTMPHRFYGHEVVLRNLSQLNLFPVFFWEEEGGIYDANDAFLTMIGYTREDLAAGRINRSTIIPQEYFAQDDAVQRSLGATGDGPRIKMEYLHKDGYRIPVYVGSIAFDTPCTRGAALPVDLSAQRGVIEELRSSEERFRLTFEQAAVGIAHVATDGSWLAVNERLCEIVGYTHDELLRLSFQAITHPEDIEADLNYVRQMLAGDIDRYQMEKRYLCKEGKTVWINLTVSLVRRRTDGTPLYFISVVEDIDDRKRAQMQAEQQAELLRLSQDAIVVRHLDGTILSWNPAAERFYGWTEQEVRGRLTHDLLQTRFPLALEEQERLLLTMRYWEGELVHTRKDGCDVIVSSRQSLHRGASDGSTALVLEANRDITEEKRARESERASQARLAAIIGSAMDAIVTTDSDQCVLTFNPAAEKMFGYSEAEIISRPIALLMPGHFGPRGETNGPKELLSVSYARRKDSTEFPIEATVSEVEADGRTIYTAIIRDVTERERTARSRHFLLELSERVRPLTDPEEIMAVTVGAIGEFLNVSYCLFTEVDVDGGTIFLHKQFAASSLPPRPGGDLQPLNLFASPEMVMRLKNGEVLAIADTASDPLTAAVYGRQLSTLSIRSVMVAPCLSGGRWIAMLGVDQDTPRDWTPDEVSLLETVAERAWRQVENVRLFQSAQEELEQRRRVEAELRQLTETLEERVAERTAALQEANESLESFNHVVAHDLRAPLRAMQGFAQALEEDYSPELDEYARDYIGRIVEGAERMNTLLWDLLAYSRLTRADLRAALLPVPLDFAVTDALKALEADIVSRGAEVRVVHPLPTVLGHRPTLAQVLMNLIGNSLKFAPAATVPQVRVWAEEPDATDGTENRSLVRLWVEDNGIGIAPEHQERIWRLFERLHGIEQYPGTGVGLAIVAKGMERMGGTAGVVSEAGRGSRFWIELPKV